VIVGFIVLNTSSKIWVTRLLKNTQSTELIMTVITHLKIAAGQHVSNNKQTDETHELDLRLTRFPLNLFAISAIVSS